MTVDVDQLRRTTVAGYIIRTLRWASDNLDRDPLLAELAQNVIDVDWTQPPAQCPLCEEPTCTPDCPLAPARR